MTEGDPLPPWQFTCPKLGRTLVPSA